MKLLVVLVLLALPALSAEKLTAPELLRLAQGPHDAGFASAVETTLTPDLIRKGTAFIGQGPDFLFAVEATAAPELVIDEQPGMPMTAAGAPGLWVATTRLATGTSHYFHYVGGGKPFGGRNDVPAYGPDSYAQPNVPQGKISEKLSFESKIYDGMRCDYWIYVPAQYNAATPAALMVWQDGHNFAVRDGGSRIQNVIDNLTAQKRIPVMLSVFIDPGKVGAKAMRSI